MNHILDPQPLTIEQAKIIGPNVADFMQKIKAETSEEGQFKVDQQKVEMCLTLAAQIPSLVQLIEKLDSENKTLKEGRQ